MSSYLMVPFGVPQWTQLVLLLLLVLLIQSMILYPLHVSQLIWRQCLTCLVTVCHNTCLTCRTPQDPATCLSCEMNRRLNGVAPSNCVSNDATCEGNSYYDETLEQCTGYNYGYDV